MKLINIFVPLFLVSPAVCTIIPVPEGEDFLDKPLHELLPQGLSDFLNEAIVDDQVDSLSISSNKYSINTTSPIYQRGVFLSHLTRTSNCRVSLDKWDCPTCNKSLSDGVVVRTMHTFPLDVNGEIVVSKKKKGIFVVIRGAESIRSKTQILLNQGQIEHPFIPGVRILKAGANTLLDIRDIVYNSVKDQIALHPDYKIVVTGHSFGAAISSLLTVDLFQRFPEKRRDISGHLLGKPRIGDRNYAKYIADHGIIIKRYVSKADDLVHFPTHQDGYEHEGEEYWFKSTDPFDFVVCPGPYETKSCSNSQKTFKRLDHLIYFDVLQGCTVRENIETSSD